MKQLIFTFLIITLASCGPAPKNNTSRALNKCLPDYHSTPNDGCVADSNIYTIEHYLTAFNQEAELHNRLEPINMAITIDETITGSVLGICYYSSNKYVKINAQWWNNPKTKNSAREYVFFHELGHCHLDRGHKSDNTNFINKPSLSTPLSIMYPSFSSANVYMNNREYYLNELFDPTYSLQNVAIHYIPQDSSPTNYMALTDDDYQESTTTFSEGHFHCNHK